MLTNKLATQPLEGALRRDTQKLHLRVALIRGQLPHVTSLVITDTSSQCVSPQQSV